MSPKPASARPQPSPDPESEGWQRARRPEHKRERRDAIVEAAIALLDEEGVEAATLSAIARRAGLSKANCYRYFESREAILLAVVLDDARDWSEAIRDRLARAAGSDDVDATAAAFVDTLVARPRLAMLIASLWSVLERNVSVDAAAEFKRSIGEIILAPAEAVAAALPRLGAEGGAAFVSQFVLFASGAWPAAHPSPVVTEVLARPEFEGMCIDFEEVLRAHARTVLLGLQAEA